MKDSLRQTLEAQWQRNADEDLFVSNANRTFPELNANGVYFWSTSPEKLSLEVVDKIFENADKCKGVYASVSQKTPDDPFTETVKVDTKREGVDLICSALALQGFRLKDIKPQERTLPFKHLNEETNTVEVIKIKQNFEAYVFERQSGVRRPSTSASGSSMISIEDNPAGTNNQLSPERRMHRTRGMSKGNRVS